MRLLVTRPEPDGERTAAALRARGCEVTVAPLLAIEWLDAPALGEGPWGGVVLTSSNAVRGLVRQAKFADLLSLPAFAVGGRTAAAARAAGFGNVVTGPGGARGLADLISQRHRGEAPLLYPAGAERSGDLAGDLAARGLPVRTVVVYRAVQATAFPDAVREALRAGQVDGVLHYSRRTAAAYLQCAGAAGLGAALLVPVQYCLSTAVAEVLQPVEPGKIRVAAHPDEAALLDLVMPP